MPDSPQTSNRGYHWQSAEHAVTRVFERFCQAVEIPQPTGMEPVIHYSKIGSHREVDSGGLT